MGKMWGFFERDGERMMCDGRASRQRVAHGAQADAELNSVLKPKWFFVDTHPLRAKTHGASASLAEVTRKAAKL